MLLNASRGVFMMENTLEFYRVYRILENESIVYNQKTPGSVQYQIKN